MNVRDPMGGCIVTVFLTLMCGAGIRADESDWFYPLGLPPKAAPRRVSGGEGVPPLPLPATPLRRTERKRDPSPPQLIAKVMWGETASFTYENGTAKQYSDWNLCPADLQQLMRKAARPLGARYGTDSVSLPLFDGDPVKTPVLFLSGTRRIKPNRQQIECLRAYVLRGGFVVCDSIAGSPYFYETIKDMVRAAFPEFAIRQIPSDHPIYHMIYDIGKVRYPKNLDSDEPFLEGIYAGCRIGVLISKYGMGCGWDNHEVPFIRQAVYYDVPSANRLGMNIVAYAVGYASVAREETKPELFGSLDEKEPTDEFVFAQIKHEGAWNVHPGGAAALLRRLRYHTSLRVSLKRLSVVPGKEDISPFTFLYLAGLDDFHFDAEAVAALRNFLSGPGTLVINNGLGLSTFDRAIRRELKKILPEAELKPVPLGHPLYGSVFPITEVRYTPAAAVQKKAGANLPHLEGITINGDLRVVYSPYDMELGWQGCEHPGAKGYDTFSAMQLGVNIVMYAVTH